jgi:hypothetical protein
MGIVIAISFALATLSVCSWGTALEKQTIQTRQEPISRMAASNDPFDEVRPTDDILLGNCLRDEGSNYS